MSELGFIDGVMTVIVLELVIAFFYWRFKLRKERELNRIDLGADQVDTPGRFADRTKYP